MTNNAHSLRYYFHALRTAEAIDFDRSRRVVQASSLLHGRSIAMRSLGIGFSLFWQRTSDALLFPLISAGFSLLLVVTSTQSLATDEVRTVEARPVSTQSLTSCPARVLPDENFAKFSMAKPHPVSAVSPTTESPAALDLVKPTCPAEIRCIPGRSCKADQMRVEPSPHFSGGLLDFEVRSVGPALFSTGSSTAETLSPFQNAAFDASYRLDNRESIGIEIGEECIAHDVLAPLDLLVGNPVTGRGSYRTIDRVTNKNSLLTWYGIFYHYTAEQWSIAPSLVPFGQFTLGFTSAGPMTQGIAGLEYRAADSYALQLGTEFTYLNYSLEGSRRASVKDALTFGIVGRW